MAPFFGPPCTCMHADDAVKDCSTAAVPRVRLTKYNIPQTLTLTQICNTNIGYRKISDFCHPLVCICDGLYECICLLFLLNLHDVIIWRLELIIIFDAFDSVSLPIVVASQNDVDALSEKCCQLVLFWLLLAVSDRRHFEALQNFVKKMAGMRPSYIC